MPMVPELALFMLAVLVLLVGLLGRRGVQVRPGSDPGSRIPPPGQAPLIGWLTLIGLLVTFGLTFFAREGATLFSGSVLQHRPAYFFNKPFSAAAARTLLALAA